MNRRKLLMTATTSGASLTGISIVSSCVQCGGNSDDDEWDDCAYARDWSACSLDNYPEYDDWSKEGAKRCENICEFGREVVFPTLTAAAIADGVPLDEVVVAKGWAAFSGGCYVIEKLDDYHEEPVEEVALYTQSTTSSNRSIARSRWKTEEATSQSDRSILVPKQIV